MNPVPFTMTNRDVRKLFCVQALQNFPIILSLQSRNGDYSSAG